MASIELYEFILDGVYYRYTSGAETITKGAQPFAPIAIRRDPLPLSDDTNKAGLAITTIYDNPFVTAALPAPQPATVTIYGELSGETWATIWKGRMVALTMQGTEAVIQTESLLSTIGRVGLYRTYQLLCNYVLYGTGCLVNPVTFKYTGTVDAIAADDITLTITGLNGEDDGYYTGGYIKIGSYAYRMIVDHTGNDIEIYSPIYGLVVTTAVDVFPGCDHLKATCQSKFSNLRNYGGFPWMPVKNPFTSVRPVKRRR